MTILLLIIAKVVYRPKAILVLRQNNTNNRAKSQLSASSTQLPEKIINVKAIDGKKMLESIQETKETESQ